MSNVSLSDVVDKIGGNVDRFNTDLQYYAGGEHYDPGSLEVVSRGIIKGSTIGYKFHYPFKKGDTLFMSRSFPDLRKAGRADYDGLCSDSSYILRTKDDTVLYPDYLPLIVQSDSFYDYCQVNEAGSVNPLINWTTLREYRFDLPPINKQIEASQIVWKMQEEIKLLEKRLTYYEELVKSRFIEMFGDPIKNPKGWEKKKLRDLLLIERGGSPRPIDDFITEDENGLNWIKIGDAKEGSYYIESVKEKIKPEGLKKTREVEPGDLLLSNSMSFGKPYIMKIPGCIHDGWLVLRDSKDRFNKLFLCIALGYPSVTQAFKGSARGAVVNNLNKDLVGALEFIVPPRDLQDRFIEFVNQVDKSKFVTKSLVNNLKRVQKSVINHYTGGE